MIWLGDEITKENVKDFFFGIAAPEEALEGDDNRMTFEGAVEFAKSSGEDGQRLLEALMEWRDSSN